MVLDGGTAMGAAETDALLAQKETGVLSLARGDRPYAIPISYGYDTSARRFYLRLVSTEDSEKRAFLDSTPDARLVVYDTDGDTYRSVVATGPLVEIPPDELTVERIAQFGGARRPLFEIWGDPRSDLDIRLYELDPDDLSGRIVTVDREEQA